MPEAGYCKACKKNVWLKEDESCQFGHHRINIRNVYEAQLQNEAQPQKPKRVKQVTEFKHTCQACGHIWHTPFKTWLQELGEEQMAKGRKNMAQGRRLANLGSALTLPFFLPGATMPMQPEETEKEDLTSKVSKVPLNRF